MHDKEKDIYIFKPYEIVPFILEKEKDGMILYERQKDKGMREHDPDWSATKTIEEAFDKSTKGCKGCASLIKGSIIPIIRKQNNWGSQYNLPQDYSGPYVDPGALSLGIPECCIIPEVEKTHKIGDDGIDIVVNTVVSCSVSTDVIRARGVIACAIALIAERMEIATRILVGYTNEGGFGFGKSKRNDFVITIKNYATPIDIPLLAFYLISPASSRRIGFSLFDSVDEGSYKSSHRFAANTAYAKDRTKKIIIDHGHIRKSMLEPEAAVEEALRILRTYGIIK